LILILFIAKIIKTWENPTKLDKDTQTYGDNDPLDIIEIGQTIAKQAEVKQVKILGVMAYIDEGIFIFSILYIFSCDNKLLIYMYINI